MFTPDQDRAAAEMLRVCRRGGKIGLANWTPEGFIGQLFKTIGTHVPPPPGVQLAGALGHARARLAELFRPRRRDPRHAAATSCSAIARRRIGWTSSAPTTVRCSRHSPRWRPRRRRRSRRDLLALIARFNRAGDGTMVVPSEYLEVVVTRR